MLERLMEHGLLLTMSLNTIFYCVFFARVSGMDTSQPASKPKSRRPPKKPKQKGKKKSGKHQTKRRINKATQNNNKRKASTQVDEPAAKRVKSSSPHERVFGTKVCPVFCVLTFPPAQSGSKVHWPEVRAQSKRLARFGLLGPL